MNAKAIRLRRVCFILMTAAAALLQNTFLPCCGTVHAVYLLIPLIAAVSMAESEIPSALFGLFAGLLWDIASPLPDGVIALFFTVYACACSLLSHYIFRKTFITALLLSSAGTILCFFTLLLLNCIIKDAGALPLLLLKLLIPSFILTQLTVPVFYFSVKAADKKYHTKAGDPL